MRLAHVVLATLALAGPLLSGEPTFDLLCSADGDGAGGGGTAPVAPPPAAPPAASPAQPPAPQAPAAPAFDVEAARAEAKAAALKELGFNDDAAFKADQKARKAEADAKLSETERNAKALKESLDARGVAEAAIDTHKGEIKALKNQIAMRDKLDAEGVSPKERIIAETLYAHAKGAKDFDEKTFFESLRKERPYLFGAAAAPSLVNTSAPPPSGGAYGAPTAPTNGVPNANDMSREQFAAYLKSQGFRA